MEETIEEKFEQEKKHRIIKIILLSLFCIVLVILYSHFLGTKGLEVKEYPIKTTYLDESFDGFCTRDRKLSPENMFSCRFHKVHLS